MHIGKLNIKIALIMVILCSFLLGFKEEKDPLHKRVFNVSHGEMKDGLPGKKVIADKFYFKDGKMFSDFISEKFGYKWIRYRIERDTIYTDSTNTEVRQLEVQAVATDENNQTINITFITEEWDIDGTIKISKNDKVRKHYDFAGREKGGKPKKEKPKKGKKVLEVVPVGQEPDKMHQETISPPGGGR